MTDDTPIETSEDEARPYQRDPTMEGVATPPGSSEQTLSYGRVDYQAGYNALNEFIRDFEIDSGEGVYFPNDQERFVIEQFVLELMNNDDAKEFIAVNFTTRIGASPLAEAASNDEDAYVIDRLAKLLAGVCIALKGEDPELHLHSFHDIVDVATKMKFELDLYRSQAAAAELATRVPTWQEQDKKGGKALPGTVRELMQAEIDALRGALAAAPQEQAPADKDAIRNAALEEAALICDKSYVEPGDLQVENCHEAAAAIRALQSQPHQVAQKGGV